MKNFTWQDLIAMKDQLIGANMNGHEGDCSYRGPISSITVGENSISFHSEWVEEADHSDCGDGQWHSTSSSSVFVNFDYSQPHQSESGVISFQIPGIGSATIDPSEREVKHLAVPRERIDIDGDSYWYDGVLCHPLT